MTEKKTQEMELLKICPNCLGHGKIIKGILKPKEWGCAASTVMIMDRHKISERCYKCIDGALP